MESRNTSRLIIALLLFIGGFMIYQNYSLNGKIEDLNDEIRWVQDSIDNSVYDISDNIEEVLREQNNRVASWQTSYKKVDTEEETVAVNMSLTLKESEDGSIVYYRIYELGETEGSGVEYVADSQNSISYYCEPVLSIKKNYQVEMYQKFKSGEVKKLIDQPKNLWIADDFANRIEMYSESIRRREQEYIFGFDLLNKYYGEPGYMVQNILVDVYLEDAVIYSQDLTVKNRIYTLTEREQVAIAAGEMDLSEMDSDSFKYGEMEAYEGTYQMGAYLIEVDMSDYMEKLEEDPKLSLGVSVTLNSGEVINLSYGFYN